MQKACLLALSVLLSCIGVFALSASSADAAFNITNFKMTPTNLQAGGHPTVNYNLNPDANLADGSNGDDIKKVTLDFPGGALGNPEAANPKCVASGSGSANKFASDKCPASSYVGSMSVKLRIKVIGNIYATVDAPGSVYILSPPTSGSAITVGFIVRPPGYKLLFMKTEVTGVVKVRSGIDADYGLTLVVDNIPRTLTTTWGSSVAATAQDISVKLNPRAGGTSTSSPNGPYFTYMPTRCDASPTRATINSYAGVSQVLTDSFTATGCANVPFTPTSSFVPSVTTAGASTGMAATFNVPQQPNVVQANGLPLQQSHVKNITVDLPNGTGLDFPAIGAVPALCSEAQLNADSCPAGSKIGSVSAVVPFLPPTMTGDVYMLARNSSVTYGYILRGANGVKAPLKGQVMAYDQNSDGEADNVRAYAQTMPQAPWSTATINFSTKLMKNPTGCGVKTINTSIVGWSGKTVNTTNSYTTTGTPVQCGTDTVPPVITITAPANGSSTTASSTTLTYTATDNSGAAPTCNKASGSSQPLVLGSNTISVTCTDAAGNSSTASVTVTRTAVANQAPVVTITAPSNGTSTTASSTTLTYTATDDSGVAPTCNKANNSSQPLALGSNTISVTCTDAGSPALSTTASVTVTRTDNTAPVINITAPVNGSSTTAASTTLTYTATDNSGAAPTCNKASGSSQPLVVGSNTISVTCVDAALNSATASVTVTRTVANTAPVVTITAPANNSTTTAASVTLTYTATDDSGVAPTCNKANNSSQPLSIGANTISVTCTDAGSPALSTTATVNVTRTVANQAPVVNITAPANGSTTTASSVVVTFTATDDSGVAPTCNRTSGSSQALVLGSNTISVTCTDAGSPALSTTATVTVTRNAPANVAPVVTITAPANNSTTTAASVTLTYTATDDSGVAPTCNKANNSSQPLSLGANTISVTCTDAGSPALSTTASVTVTRTDNTPPVITITAPVNGSSTTATSTVVTFTATDNSGATPTCNRVSGSSQALVLGSNTITVNCTDAAGNTGTATTTVTRTNDPPPVVNITAPVNNSSTNAASVTLTYTATDNSGIAPTCDKASGSSQPLSLGSNTISVTCTDNVGGSTTASVTVTRTDNVAPVVTITAPTNNSSTPNATTTLTYTATDNSGVAPTCNKANNSVQNLVLGANVISVTCTDAAGNSTTASVTVTRTDTGAPVVTITAPVNGSTTTAATTTLTYTATDNSGVAPTCDKANNSSQPLALGSNTISVTCTDGSSNSTTASVTVTRTDNVAPVISITAPVNGSSTTAASVTLTFTATDNSGAAPTCNKVSGSSQPLVLGSNVISVTCTDASSNSATASVTVTRTDNTPPVITITAPVNGSTTTAASVNLVYTVTDNSGVAPTCTKANNSPQALAIGLNTISVSCTDGSSNTSTASTQVTRSSDPPPVVTITAPANNSSTTAATTTLTYTATDDSGIAPTCNKANNSSQPLAFGVNTISVTCTDNVGGSTTASVTVTRTDNVAPVISITAPVNGSSTTAATTTLTFTATDNSGATPTCNKTSGSSQPLNLGSNVISVTCTDGSSNSATASVTVTRLDNTPPVVTITAPVNGSSTTAASVNVTYTATDNSGAAPTCNRVNNSSQALVLGANTISVTCTDAASNSTTASVTVTRLDNTAPVVTITAPANNSSTTAASTTLTYTATDNSGVAPTCDKANNSSQPLSLGSNTISVTCTDAASNSTTASVTVTRTDNTAPVVTITAPTNGSSTTAATTTLTYTATDNSGVAPTCNKANNSSQPLTFGSNVISVTCTDGASNSTTASVTVTRTDNVAPVVTITAPTNNSSTTAATTTLVYTATDNSGVAPTCNKANNSSQPLTLGVNSISVTCTDGSSNSTTASVTVTRTDNTPPVITITAPVNGSSTTAATTTLTYTVTDNSGATPTCTKASGSSQPLNFGSNVISVTCTDGSSNSSTASVTVTRTDNVAPVVTITAPTNNSSTTAASTTLVYTATDNSGVAPTCNKANNSSQPLALGVNTISVTCTDGSSNSTTASVTVTRTDNTPPVITITAPTNGSSTTAATTTLTYTVTDNSGATPTCTKASGSSQPLNFGSNVISVTCTDGSSNSSTASVTVTRTDNVAPVVTITAPVNGSTTTNASVTLTYTATDNSGATPTCDKANNSSQALVVGMNTISVTCTDGSSNSTTASVTVTRQNVTPPPVLTVSAFAPPSTKTTGTPRAATFSATNSPTGYLCRSGYGAGGTAVTAQTFAACSSPWSVTVPAGIPNGTNIDYEIKATNAAGDSNVVKGFTWLDDRAFTATPTVTPITNSLVTNAADANDAGKHPSITAGLQVIGYDDAETVDITFPDGLMGSLKSIPVANRCTNTQALAGTCPASALVGTLSGTATSSTDGSVSASGNLYLVDSGQLDSAYAAGVALDIDTITGPISGDLGDIYAVGNLSINDAARNLRLRVFDIPRQTTTSKPFHAQNVNLTIAGDTGGAGNALITNPHFCGTANTLRPNAKNFYGTGTSYQGNTTPTVTAAYVVDNCTAVPFNPAVNTTLSSYEAGTLTTMTTTVSLPYDHSPLRQVVARLPTFLGPNLPSFGDTAADQCAAGAFSTGGSVITTPHAYLTQNYNEFTPVNCPAQARAGSAVLTTPLLPGTVTADVWLIAKSPIPNIGVYVDPTKYGNPQGVNIGLYGTTSTPQVDGSCDPLETECPTQIVAQFSSAPDVPLTSMALTMGGVTGRVSEGPGTPALSSQLLAIAGANDTSCQSAGENMLTALYAWSNPVPAVNRPQLIVPTGCNF